MEAGAYARIEGRNCEYYMTKRRVVIGRNSKLGNVDVNMGSSRFISRKHLEILLDRNMFFILCRGKNGIFVDDTFQRRENKRLQLPNSCIIRFPSTQIKLAFTSLLEDLGPPPPMHSPALPLKLDTQLTSPFVSPMPSPTGTISAVNSCPVSPNAGFRQPNFDFKAMATYASKLLSDNDHIEKSASSGGESGNDQMITEEVGVANSESNQDSQLGGDSEVNEIVNVPEEGEDNPDNYSSDKASQEDVDKLASEKSHQKPPYSYAQLIVQALLASKERKQTLSNIYAFISDKYPHYKLEDKGWKNSIRHNLSLNQYFMKAPREKEGLGFGKGGYWCMHPDYEEKLTSQAYVKRKKKGIPVFPSTGLVSRSAPPSPTHHPFISSELNMEKYSVPTKPAVTSHFTLPQFFSQISASSSSHSLPASPSRPPAGFTATPLKFFPMPVRSNSTDDLHHKSKLVQEVPGGHDDGRDEGIPPPTKRIRIDERSMEHRGGSSGHDGVRGGGGGGDMKARPIQMPTITSLPTGGASLQPGGVQLFSIPLMSSAQPPPGLLNQPLSSFFPQNFFAPGSAAVAAAAAAAAAHSNQQNQNDNGTGHSSDNEG